MLLLPRINRLVPVVLLSSLALSACSGPGPQAGSPAPTSDVGDGHGYIAGAEEVAEPPLHLLTLGADGSVDQMDLLDESWGAIGAIGRVTDSTTDGRFVFASDSDTGTVTIVDSGMWTRNHEDHFHYYRASPRVVGTVNGKGPATVSPGSTATGLFYPETGLGVLLDNAALGDGDIVERIRLQLDPHAGSLVQLGSITLATTPDAAGTASGVEALDADGRAIDGSAATCAEAGAPVTTSVGVAFPCTDGALLVSTNADGIRFEHIGYPESGAPAAPSFAARKGRPTVAGLAGGAGVWLLDTRERSLLLIPTETQLLQVVAVDDEEGHLLGLTTDGRVTVISAADGSTLATTEPLLPETIADPPLLASVELVVDQQRAYLNAPAEQRLYEIDFADSARIARTFPTRGIPLFLAETGR